MNRLTQLFTVAMVTLSLNACLSDRQPDRHNYVEGGKRIPALNQMTANPSVPYPTEDMLYPPVQNPPPLPPIEQQQAAGLPPQTQTVPPTGEMSPQQAPNAPLEASPLYYYEQQQQQEAVGVAPLPEAAVAPNDITPNDMATAPVQPAVSPTSPQVGLEPSPLAAATSANDTALTPTPSVEAASPALAPQEVEIKEGMAGSPADYPSLRDVPEKQAPVTESFAQAKQDAKAFQAEKESLGTPVAEQSAMDAVSPAATVASPAAGEVMHEQTLDELLAKEVIEDASKEEQIEEITTPQTAPPSPVDFSQQPLPATPTSPPPPSAAPVNAPVENAAPVFAEDDATAPAVVNAAPVTLTPPPPPQTVEVETAPLVAAQPRNQRIYTNGGVVELTPPSSIRSRAGELPQSRYYERRQLQQYRTRNATY